MLGGTILTLVEGVGDFALKKYAIGGTWGFLPAGVSIYLVLAFTHGIRHLECDLGRTQ